MQEFVYRSTPQGDLRMHVCLPPGAAAVARPGIVFFHGGGWRGGTPQQFYPQMEYLASRGLVAAGAEYRLTGVQGVTLAACVQDAFAAVRWLAEQAERFALDPALLLAAGGSAGGHLAACCALLDGSAAGPEAPPPVRPAALVLFNPVLDLRDPRRQEAFGFSAEEAQRLSPNAHLDAPPPPAVLFYGSDDEYLADGRAYTEQARALDSRAELWIAPGQRHAFFNGEPWRDITLAAAERFLASRGFLDGASTLQPPAQPVLQAG